MNRVSEPDHTAAPPSFTAKQRQYLAFIHAYTQVLGRPRVVLRLKPICKDTSA
jgi:hypothetical protein